MPTQTPWQHIFSDVNEEFMRLVKQSEDYVYDVMLPSLLPLQPPAQRKAFYAQLDWDNLKVTSAGLYTRLTADALSLEEADRKKQEQALAELQRTEAQQNSQFKPQVSVGSVMGLHEPGTSRTSTTSAGMDVPLGVLSAGAGMGVR